jgi:SagB-type dehydrogenase family enzyme
MSNNRDVGNRSLLREVTVVVITALVIVLPGGGCTADPEPVAGPSTVDFGGVPEAGGVSLNEALRGRRSIREFDDRELELAELGALLWATQGITSDRGGRTAPSAGATYPLEIYVATAQRVLHYMPREHAAEVVLVRDIRSELHRAGLSQGAIADAPAVFVVAAEPARTTAVYGDRGERYVLLEAGHAAQNLLLEAVSLGLAAVPIGAFDDDTVRDLVGLPSNAIVLYLIPVGHPTRG